MSGKKLLLYLGLILVGYVALTGSCGQLSTALVNTSTSAANIQQKQIEQAQVDANLFEGVNPDLAYGLREMRLSNEHSNDTIARVAESADRSQTTIAMGAPITAVAIAVALVAFAYIISKAGKKNE